MHTPELIDSIRILLDNRVSSIPSEVLAVAYAKQCRGINERLEKIGGMLESGGEIQALQLAEQDPRVVDLALALSFGGEAAWQDYCRHHGHEVAPLVNARTLEALLEIQNKGISPNHPLYKDYRTAISKRDDVQAHNLIRVIARMNPGDDNAAKELKRLQRKALQSALIHMKNSIDAGDEILLAAMTKVEEAGLPEDYESSAEWKQAMALRTRIRRTAAWQRMPRALEEAEKELEAGRWRQAAVLHGEYVGLVASYGHEAAAAASLGQRSMAMDGELDKHRAEAERLATASQLVAEMERIADDVEVRVMTPLGLSADYAGPLAEDLTRKMRHLDSLRGEFPENRRKRVETAHGLLVKAMESARRGRRARLIMAVSSVVLILLAGACFGALAFRVSVHAEHLALLRNNKSSVGLRELVAQIKDKESLLLRFPGLTAEVAQASQWLQTADAKQEIVKSELSALESKRGSFFAEMPSPDLFAKLREVSMLLSELPADMVAEADSRLAVIRNDGERVLAKRQEENDINARALVARWVKLLDSIDPTESAAKAGKLIESAPRELESYLKLASLEHQSLQLPAASAAMVADLDARVSDLMQRVHAVAAALDAIEGATTLLQYREGLRLLAETSFCEAVSAQRILDTLTDDERIKAHLVFRGDLTALKAAEGDDRLMVPVPEAAVSGDREAISELSSSSVLNELWELEWRDPAGTNHKSLSKGELRGDAQAGWTGMTTSYPKLTASELHFQNTRVPSNQGYVMVSNRATATCKMMSRLGLDKLLDDTGSSFKSSILPILDSVANDSEAHPLAKAFVYGRLLVLLRNHKQEDWGLHYCPGLIDDLKAFEKLSMKAPISEQSWLVDGKEAITLEWERYFSTRGHRSSYSELCKTRAASIEVLRNPLLLAGHVLPNGSSSINPGTGPRLILAIVGQGDGESELAVCGIVDKNGVWRAEQPAILPYSPLISIELGEESQIFLASIHPKKSHDGKSSSSP